MLDERIPGLGDLIVRMAALTTDATKHEAQQVTRAWRKLKRDIERLATEPGQAEDTLLAIYRLPGFRNYQAVNRKRWRATETYKRQQAKVHKAWRTKVAADPVRLGEQKARKRAYDRARYEAKKQATNG